MAGRSRTGRNRNICFTTISLIASAPRHKPFLAKLFAKLAQRNRAVVGGEITQRGVAPETNSGSGDLFRPTAAGAND